MNPAEKAEETFSIRQFVEVILVSRLIWPVRGHTVELFEVSTFSPWRSIVVLWQVASGGRNPRWPRNNFAPCASPRQRGCQHL